MFNVILGAQVGRARPKIYSILIYEPWPADCNRLLERSKNYFVVTHSNLKASFKKKPRTTIKQSKTKTMPYIWFWVHWLAEHAPKFVQYQFNKLGLLTTRDPQEGEKIIWKFVFLSRKQVITKKKKQHYEKKKKSQNVLCVILGAQVGRACPKICSISIYQPWPADCNRPLERSKNYFEVTHSNSKASIKKKPWRTIKQSKTKTMPYIWFWVHWFAEHAPKCVQYQFTKLGWLTTSDPKEGAKIIWKFVFLSRQQVTRKNKQHYEKWEKSQKVLYVILGALVRRARPQNLFNILLLNLVGWMRQALRKEQKLFWSYSF